MASKGYRRIQRYYDEAVLERVKARMEAWPEAMALRKKTVEHPFGSIKHWMGQRDFLTCRLPNVRAEFSLTALAYNMEKPNVLTSSATEIWPCSVSSVFRVEELPMNHYLTVPIFVLMTNSVFADADPNRRADLIAKDLNISE